MQVAIPDQPQGPIAVAVSSCLLGQPVRFDGAHKRSSLCHDQLDSVLEFTGFCPEVAIGLGVPRPPIRLTGDPANPRATGIADSSMDVTDALAAEAKKVDLAPFAGYIFMKKSPSCGLHRVKVYTGENRPPDPTGRGIYAAGITTRFPNLPCEESGRLEDAAIRENFVAQVFTYAHWQALAATELTPGRLIAFHSRYKYAVMAHSIQAYKDLGRLLSDLSSDLSDIAARYIAGLMQALREPPSSAGHANVLHHLQGYVKDHLDSESRQELAATIHAYRRGELPLMAPITLLKHHLAQHADEYARAQTYLNPHPATAAMRRAL